MMWNDLRVVVGGYLGLLPAGGVTWDYIQYPLGFAELGCDVYYVEDTRLWPVYQDQSSADAGDCAANVSHLANAMEAFGMGNRWAYRDEASGKYFGLSQTQVKEVCDSADVFVNVSCSTFLRDEYRRIPVRILIDSDPMFTQIQCMRQEGLTAGGQGDMRQLLAAHTHLFTFGENMGAADCRIPDCGFVWQTTRQPICLDHWPATLLPNDSSLGYTSVMNWSAAPALEYAGESWGQKNVEFWSFMDAPRQLPEIALAVAVGQTTGAPFPRETARSHGWRVWKPDECVPDWASYRDFIVRSRGEFSVAKETYVKARTGWFSCRSACYLAAARPVVAQETGWSQHLPCGEGLFTFSSMQEAAEAVREIERDYVRHSQAARQIAETCFDSRRVLSRMLETAGV